MDVSDDEEPKQLVESELYCCALDPEYKVRDKKNHNCRNNWVRCYAIFTLAVVATTVVSWISVVTSTWVITDFDTPLEVTAANPATKFYIESVQYGPIFYCLKNRHDVFEDTNINCQINFVDNTESHAMSFNYLRSWAMITAALATVFYASFWNQRAFFEFRQTILWSQIVAGLITVSIFEATGTVEPDLNHARDYVWAVYSGGETDRFAIGYLGFVFSNIIAPVIYSITLWMLMRLQGNTSRICNCKTWGWNTCHVFWIFLTCILYIYCATASTWATVDIAADNTAAITAVTESAAKNSLGYLLHNQEMASWGRPERLEQGVWSECTLFENYQHCHTDLFGSDDRIRTIGTLRVFVIGGLTTAISCTFLSLTRIFEDQVMVYDFVKIVLPLLNSICTLVALFVWALAGDDDWLSNQGDNDAVWSGTIGASWGGLIVCWFTFTSICAYFKYHRNWYFDPANADSEHRMLQKTMDLPPDPHWTLVPTLNELRGIDELPFEKREECVAKERALNAVDYDARYFAVLFCCFAAFIMFGVASVQEWNVLTVNVGTEKIEIKTYIFGYSCMTVSPNDSPEITTCDDGLKFAGTKTRMNKMQSLFSLYFISNMLLIWGTYEHIRNAMKPFLRLIWFFVTMICAFACLGLFMGNGGELEFAKFQNFTSNRGSTYVIADMYDGADITYVTDLKNVPPTITSDAELTGFYWLFVMAVLFTGAAWLIQVYDYVYFWGKQMSTMRRRAASITGGASIQNTSDKENDGL